MSAMLPILQELHRLLIESGHPGQANFVEQLIALLSTDHEKFVRLLQSVGMWGGAGAVWEVEPLNMNEQAFRAGIIALAAEMDAQGIGMERSRWISYVFQEWNKAGL
jgi:hypothetical protein